MEDSLEIELGTEDTDRFIVFKGDFSLIQSLLNTDQSIRNRWNTLFVEQEDYNSQTEDEMMFNFSKREAALKFIDDWFSKLEKKYEFSFSWVIDGQFYTSVSDILSNCYNQGSLVSRPIPRNKR